MKKLMIAAAIVCAAAVSQAATVNWGESWGIDMPESDWVPATGLNAYLIQTSAHSQDAFVSAFKDAGSASAFVSTLAAWNAVNAAAVTGEYGDFYVEGATSSAFTAGDAEKAYIAVIDTANDRVFMGVSDSVTYNGLGDVYDILREGNDQDASLLPVWDAAAGNQGAGWYAAGSSPTPTPTPEPTSGLLLLLGVAGLALRRRRA